jgi:plastocyanin
MKKINFFTYILALGICSLTAVSCGKGTTYNSGNNGGSGNNSSGSGNAVSMVNMSFTPATLTVAVGTTVVWTNDDVVTHTVTSNSSSFDSGNLTPGNKFSMTFSTAGTYAYHCKIHSYMNGSIVVH